MNGLNQTVPTHVLHGVRNHSTSLSNASVHELDGRGFAGPEDRMNPFLAIMLLYGIMLLLLAAQGGLYYWRKQHKRSYELVTLLGLWLIPAVVSVQLKYWRFIAVWAIYSAITARLLHLCWRKRLARTTPRSVYAWFLGVYKYCKVLGISGYVLLLLELLGVGTLLRPFLPPDLALDMVWYGLYFGVLGRDCAEVAADALSANLGMEGRQLVARVHNCGICGQELCDDLVPGASPGPRAEQTVQLSCRHCFHDMCIRGWTVVGKKDTCPQCCEKVDLRMLYADRPWETHNISWIQMMDGLRYLVVWNPVILCILSLVMHLFAPHHPHLHPNSGGHVAGAMHTMAAVNATGTGQMPLTVPAPTALAGNFTHHTKAA